MSSWFSILTPIITGLLTLAGIWAAIRKNNFERVLQETAILIRSTPAEWQGFSGVDPKDLESREVYRRITMRDEKQLETDDLLVTRTVTIANHSSTVARDVRIIVDGSLVHAADDIFSENYAHDESQLYPDHPSRDDLGTLHVGAVAPGETMEFRILYAPFGLGTHEHEPTLMGTRGIELIYALGNRYVRLDSVGNIRKIPRRHEPQDDFIAVKATVEPRGEALND